MLYIRSLAFNALFYLNLVVQMIVWTPFYFLAPRRSAWFVPKFWSRTSMWLYDKVAATGSEISGTENLPKGSFILAPKHQSFWDTIAFFPYLDDALYILKRELMWIPLFGWYLWKQRMIPVNRGARGKVMLEVLKRTRIEMAAGRQLIIYPEGTRRPPGATPEYKYGIARMYRDLGVPVVPVAMHPGLFWPRRSTMRYPGHFKVRILAPIQPGMDPDAFFAHLIDVTEKASDELLLDTVARNPDLPLPQTAIDRLAVLRQTKAASA